VDFSKYQEPQLSKCTAHFKVGIDMVHKQQHFAPVKDVNKSQPLPDSFWDLGFHGLVRPQISRKEFTGKEYLYEAVHVKYILMSALSGTAFSN
jgi:hypothetical protein